MVRKKKASRLPVALMAASVLGVHFIASGVTASAAVPYPYPGTFSNIEIESEEPGVLVIDGSAMLFDLEGMYPGDSCESTVTVKNKDTEGGPFVLTMYAKDKDNVDEFDFGKVTRLTINVDGQADNIFDGWLIEPDAMNPADKALLARTDAAGNDYRGITIPLSDDLPRGEPGITLVFNLSIDGPSATYHYMGQSSDFSIVFRADSTTGPQPSPSSQPSPSTTPGTDNNRRSTTDTTTTDTSPDAASQTAAEADAQTAADTPAETLEGETPLGPVDLPGDGIEELPPGETPLAFKEMPKTGENSLALYVIPGALIAACGLYILIRNGKKES